MVFRHDNAASTPICRIDQALSGEDVDLSVICLLVSQRGGHVQVSQTSARGTTLEIFLPPADLSNRHAEPTDSCLPVAGQSFRILVVDDDEPLRVFTSTVLEEDGYCVLNASNGEEALQICERDPASIHLLVADVVMPRLSGRQLATQFLTLYRDAKVLLISGYPSLSGVLNGIASRSEALQAQCDFLPKPFTGADLLRKVRTLLGHSIEESAETAQA